MSSVSKSVWTLCSSADNCDARYTYVLSPHTHASDKSSLLFLVPSISLSVVYVTYREAAKYVTDTGQITQFVCISNAIRSCLHIHASKINNPWHLFLMQVDGESIDFCLQSWSFFNIGIILPGTTWQRHAWACGLLLGCDYLWLNCVARLRAFCGMRFSQSFAASCRGSVHCGCRRVKV